jgi:hypothetical protein
VPPVNANARSRRPRRGITAPPVVVGAPGWVTKDLIGGQDFLQGCVGRSAGLVLFGTTGVWVVLAKQRSVGMAELGLGCGRRESQDGVEVGPCCFHDRDWTSGWLCEDGCVDRPAKWCAVRARASRSVRQALRVGTCGRGKQSPRER